MGRPFWYASELVYPGIHPRTRGEILTLKIGHVFYPLQPGLDFNGTGQIFKFHFPGKAFSGGKNILLPPLPGASKGSCPHCPHGGAALAFHTFSAAAVVASSRRHRPPLGFRSLVSDVSSVRRFVLSRIAVALIR